MHSDEAKIKWGEYLDSALLEQWPRTDDGEAEKAVYLCSRTSSDLSDRILVNMLSAYGIPCLVMERGNGNLGRLYLGISGFGTDIYVPESLLHHAKQLCEEENHEEL